VSLIAFSLQPSQAFSLLWCCSASSFHFLLTDSSGLGRLNNAPAPKKASLFMERGKYKTTENGQERKVGTKREILGGSGRMVVLHICVYTSLNWIFARVSAHTLWPLEFLLCFRFLSIYLCCAVCWMWHRVRPVTLTMNVSTAAQHRPNLK
jgi:hypothetical protein